MSEKFIPTFLCFRGNYICRLSSTIKQSGLLILQFVILCQEVTPVCSITLVRRHKNFTKVNICDLLRNHLPRRIRARNPLNSIYIKNPFIGLTNERDLFPRKANSSEHTMQKIGVGLRNKLRRRDLFGTVELQLNKADLAKKMGKIKALCVSNRAYGV